MNCEVRFWTIFLFCLFYIFRVYNVGVAVGGGLGRVDLLLRGGGGGGPEVAAGAQPGPGPQLGDQGDHLPLQSQGQRCASQSGKPVSPHVQIQ